MESLAPEMFDDIQRDFISFDGLLLMQTGYVLLRVYEERIQSNKRNGQPGVYWVSLTYWHESVKPLQYYCSCVSILLR